MARPSARIFFWGKETRRQLRLIIVNGPFRYSKPRFRPRVRPGVPRFVGLASQARLCYTLLAPRPPAAYWLRGHPPTARQSPLDKVPSAHFDSDQYPLAEGLAAWRRMTASLYQTWPRGEPERFRARADGFQVGGLVFNQAQFTPARFLHGPERLVGEGRDFLSLQMQLAGEERLIMAHGHVRLLPGHIYLRDWAYAFDSEASAMRLHAIMIPRHRLRAGASMQAHTPVLSWSMSEPDGRMLAMLWQQLLAELAAEAPALVDAALALPDEELGASSPALAIASSLHEEQYTRLFRS